MVFLKTNIGRLLAEIGLLTAGVVGQATAQMPSNLTIRPSHSIADMTAFDGQGFDAKYGVVAKSTIMLLAVRDNKIVGEGSGILIADSAVTPSAGVRFLTDAHVSDLRTKDNEAPRKPVKRWMVFSSRGVYLGDAKPVALGTTDVAYSNVDDLAVGEMTRFEGPAAETEYKKIPGIKLAPVQASSGFEVVYTTGKAGIAAGASGGPWVNEAGDLVGLAGSVPNNNIGMVQLDRPVMFDRNNRIVTGDPITNQKIDTSDNGLGFLNTISSWLILDALGNAGKAVTIGPTMPGKRIGFGYPAGVAMVYEGNGHRLDPQNVAEFVDIQKSVSATPIFPDWHDPVKSRDYVLDLLQQARKTHHSRDLDLAIATVQSVENLTDLAYLTFDIDLTRIAQTVRDPQLKLALTEAACMSLAEESAIGMQKKYIGLSRSSAAPAHGQAEQVERKGADIPKGGTAKPSIIASGPPF